MKKRKGQSIDEEQAALFSALADTTRLKLVKQLCQQHGAHALCVNVLASILGVSQPAVSQHLRILKNLGLVRGERRGYHIHYSVNPDAVKRCQKLMSAALNIPRPASEKQNKQVE